MIQNPFVIKKKPLVVLPLILMIGIAGGLFLQFGRLMATTKWIDHTDLVIAQVNLIERQVIDLQNSLRGFVLMGDPEMLQSYHKTQNELANTIDNFRELVRGSPLQLKRINDVVSKIEEWEQHAREVTTIKKTNGDFSSMNRRRPGSIIIQSIREKIVEIRFAEEQLKAQRLLSSEKESESIFWISIFSFVSIALVLFRSLILRERFEESLLFSEEKYRTLIGSAYDGILIVDDFGKIESSNDQIHKMFGYSAAELINKPLQMLVPDQIEHISAVHRFSGGARQVALRMGAALDLVGVTKEGVKIPIDISLSAIKTDRGTFATAIIHDIREIKNLLLERQSLLEKEKSARTEAECARVEAERASDAKDIFLATLSHELRTPLTSILLRAQLIRQYEKISERASLGIEQIERSANVQGQMINDLLDIARIQTGKLSINLVEVEPYQVVCEAIKAMRPLAMSKNIEVYLFGCTRIGTVKGDSSRLQQVFSNLLTNAIKFSPAGGRIEVHIEKIEDNGRPYGLIRVVDYGKGIAPNFIPQIFNRFSQQDSTSIRIHGGLGIGLALVRDLVRSHGGSVGVESAGVNMGATFKVLLPLMKETPNDEVLKVEFTREAIPSSPAKLSSLKVLIVEDDLNSLEVFCELIKVLGGHPIPCGCVKDALVSFSKNRPDIIVSDIAMPQEDGYSFIRKIRSLSKEQGGRVPAIAVTAFAACHDMANAIEAGFQEHLAKPIDGEKLASVITRLAMANLA